MIEFNDKKLVFCSLGDNNIQSVYRGPKLIWGNDLPNILISGKYDMMVQNANGYYIVINGQTKYPTNGRKPTNESFEYKLYDEVWEYGTNNNTRWFDGFEELDQLKGFPKLESLENVFFSCSGLKLIPATVDIDVSTTTNFKGMFQDCRDLISIDLSSWKVDVRPENVDFTNMFNGCSNLEVIDIHNWIPGAIKGNANMETSYGENKSIVTNMFKGCTKLNKIICNTSNVMGGTLKNWMDLVLKDSGLDTSKITFE